VLFNVRMLYCGEDESVSDGLAGRFCYSVIGQKL